MTDEIDGPLNLCDTVCGLTDCVEEVVTEVRNDSVKRQDYRCDDHVDCWRYTELCACHGMCEFPSDVFAFCWNCGCAEDCDSVGKRKDKTEGLSVSTSTSCSKVRKVSRGVSCNLEVMDCDSLEYQRDYKEEDSEGQTTRDNFSDTGCSGVCNYLHLELSACTSCSWRNLGVRVPALDDVEGNICMTSVVYRDVSTNTVCAESCDFLDGLSTCCLRCNDFQCKRCVSGGLGRMCYDCIDELERNVNVDLDALDVVGGIRSVEHAPLSLLPKDLDCRLVRTGVKVDEVSTDPYVDVEDTDLLKGVRYLTRDSIPVYCFGHGECVLNKECVCACVGDACVFNRTGDTCIRCLCDSQPYRPAECETEVLSESLKESMEKPVGLASDNPDATTLVASGAVFSETFGNPLESTVLKCVSASDQVEALKHEYRAVSAVRTVRTKHSRTVKGSCSYGDDRNKRRNCESRKEERKRNPRRNSFFVDQDGGCTRLVEEWRRDSETRWGETSPGSSGGDSCPTVVSSGAVACGSRERDSCTPASNGSKLEQGTVGSMGTSRVASGLLAHSQSRRSARPDRPRTRLLDCASGADLQRQEGELNEFEILGLSPPYSLPVITDTEQEQVITLLRSRSESLRDMNSDGTTEIMVELKRKSKFLHVNKLKKMSEPLTSTTPDPHPLH